jgi:hypothetical protein
MDKVKVVKISTPFDAPVFLRQTPLSNGRWGGYQFVENEHISECDYWIIYEGLTENESCRCDPSKIYFVSGEPPEHKAYSSLFLKQFSHVITGHRINHRGLISSQQSLPWHVGFNHSSQKMNLEYDELKKDLSIQKLNKISVITSAQTRLTGHRTRLNMIDILKEEFGDQIDLFGRGVNPVDDKWEALAPYKYHMAFENSQVNHYWTEKLADPFLAECFPIYWGAPDISSYFDTNSMYDMNGKNIDEVIHFLHSILNDDQHYSKALDAVRASKQKVLGEYNLMPSMISFFDINPSTGIKIEIGLKPQSEFNSDQILNRYILPAKRVLKKRFFNNE